MRSLPLYRGTSAWSYSVSKRVQNTSQTSISRRCSSRETHPAKQCSASVFVILDVGLCMIRRTQEGCGGLGGESPAAFPQARPIFQQPFSLPESAQTLAGIAFRAAGKSGNHFPAASKFAGKPFQQGISDSHSLLEFSDMKGHFQNY